MFIRFHLLYPLIHFQIKFTYRCLQRVNFQRELRASGDIPYLKSLDKDCEAPMFQLALPAVLLRLTYQAPQLEPLFELPPKSAKAVTASPILLSNHDAKDTLRFPLHTFPVQAI